MVPAVFKTVERRSTRLWCVRFAPSPPAFACEERAQRRLPRRSSVESGLGVHHSNGKLRLGRPVNTKRRRAKTSEYKYCLRASEKAKAGNDALTIMPKFYYVYILQSETDPARFYVGRTEDLKERLMRHNRGEVPSTSPNKPWKIQTAIAFSESNKAIEFEKYLKSGSGRAFAKRRL